MPASIGLLRVLVVVWVVITCGCLPGLERAAYAQSLPTDKPYTKQQVEWVAKRNPAKTTALTMAESDIDQAVQYSEKLLAGDRQVFGSVHKETAETLQFLSDLYYRKADYARAIAAAREVRGIHANLLGEKHWRTRFEDYRVQRLEHMAKLTDADRGRWNQASALHGKAIEFWARSELKKALEAALESKRLYEGLLGTKNPDYAECLRIEAMVRISMNELDRAEVLLEEAGQLFSGIYGPTSSNSASVLSVWGDLYQARGSAVRAERAYRGALEIIERESAGQGLQFAMILGRAGRNYLALNDASRALAMLQQRLKVVEAAVGKQQPEYVNALNDYGAAVRRAGKPDEAEKLHREAFGIQQGLPVADPIGLAFTKMLLVEALLQRDGNAIEAVRLLDSIEPVFKKADGNQQLNYANVLLKYVEAYRQLKQYEVAEKTAREVLEIRRKLLGNDDQMTRRAVDRIGSLAALRSDVLAKEGKFDEGAQVLRNAQTTISEVYGPDHWLTLMAEMNVVRYEKLSSLAPELRERIFEANLISEQGAQMRKDGRNREALSIYEKIRAAYEAAFGLDDPVLPLVLSELGACHMACGQLDAAVPLLKKSAELYILAFGEHEPPPEVKNVQYTLACAYEQRGDLDQAIALYAEARESVRRGSGTRSPDFSHVTNDLAVALASTGDFDQARALLLENLDLQERRAGKQSETYADTLTALSITHFRNNEFEAGIKRFKEARDLYLAIGKGENLVRERQLWLHLEYGTFCAKIGDAKEALSNLEWARGALEKFTSVRHPIFLTTCLRGLSLAYLIQGEYAKSEEVLREAIAMQRNQFPGVPAVFQSEANLLGQTYNRWALTLFQKEQTGEAAAVLERGVTVWTEILGPDHWRTRDAANRAGFAKKIATLEPADRKELVTLIAPEGNVVGAPGGNLAQAAKNLGNSLAALKAKVKEENVYYLELMNVHSMLLMQLGDHAAARQEATQVLMAGARLTGFESELVGASAQCEAMIARYVGQYPLAIKELRRAVKAYEAAYGSHAPQLGTALYLLGEMALDSGNLEEALSALRRAYAILSQHQSLNLANYLNTLGAYGRVCQKLKDYERAELLLTRGYEKSGQVKEVNNFYRAVAALNLGGYYAETRQFDRAEKLLREAVDRQRKLTGAESPYYAQALRSLANVLLEKGDTLVSGPLYQQVIDLFSKGSGKNSYQVALTYLQRGRVAFARGEFQEAKADLERTKAIATQSGSQFSAMLADCLVLEGDLAVQRQDKARAAACYQQNYEYYLSQAEKNALLMTETQQLEEIKRQRELVGWLLSLDPGPESVEGVYATVLAWKGAVFARQQRLRKMLADDSAQKKFQDWERLTGHLATLALRPPLPEERDIWQAQVIQLTRQRDDVERELAQLTAVPVDKVTVAGLLDTLPPNAALIDAVDYTRRVPRPDDPGQWQTEQRLLAFVLRPGRAIAVVDLGETSAAAKEVDAWLEAIEAKKDVDELTPLGRSLAARLWKPLVRFVEGADVVLLSADGPLTRIPLGGLPAEDERRFLIEDYAIVLAPSPALLPGMLTEPASSQFDMLLAIGDVNYGGQGGWQAVRGAEVVGNARSALSLRFQKLENTGPEADSVVVAHQASGGKNSLVIKGSQATESAFRQNAVKARWLHLATHAFYAPDEVRSALEPALAGRPSGPEETEKRVKMAISFHPGLLSGLTLAGANLPNDPDEDDGLLSAMEVAAMDLSGVELAVLSACQTAQGQEAGGEGVLGLQRAFQVAGTRSVVSTYWSISDLGTRVLMMRFYENLWEKRMSKLEALRDAQRWILDGARAAKKSGAKITSVTTDSTELPPAFLAPSIWAPFVLSGDWR